MRSNIPPGPHRLVRMVVRDSADFRGDGVSVTVGAMTAISVAMANYLTERDGSVPPELGAEVTIAKQVHPRRAITSAMQVSGCSRKSMIFVSEPN